MATGRAAVDTWRRQGASALDTGRALRHNFDVNCYPWSLMEAAIPKRLLPGGVLDEMARPPMADLLSATTTPFWKLNSRHWNDALGFPKISCRNGFEMECAQPRILPEMIDCGSDRDRSVLETACIAALRPQFPTRGKAI